MRWSTVPFSVISLPLGKSGLAPAPLPRTPARVDPDLGPSNVHARRVDLDEACAGLDGQLRACFDDVLAACHHVGFPAHGDKSLVANSTVTSCPGPSGDR